MGKAKPPFTSLGVSLLLSPATPPFSSSSGGGEGGGGRAEEDLSHFSLLWLHYWRDKWFFSNGGKTRTGDSFFKKILEAAKTGLPLPQHVAIEDDASQLYY